MLAVTGPRADGYHELVSVAAPLELADGLEAAHLPDAAPGTPDELDCAGEGVPAGAGNLVLRAAAAFRERVELAGAVRFRLRKRIPVGAGLGGGSSDAAAALRAMNELAGKPLGADALREVAAGVGSDCALFLVGGPVVMRGRGERVEPLAEAGAAALAGLEVALFKPHYGVPTGWAYGALRAAPGSYTQAAEAAGLAAQWAEGKGVEQRCLHNTFEAVVLRKYLGLAAVVAEARGLPGVRCQLSGSGSACFALGGGAALAQVAELARGRLGPDGWVARTRIRGRA